MILLPKGKIAIAPIYDPDRTKGGLFIPDQAKERCDQGIVKYIAPDEERFKIGDYVLFSAYDGTLVQLEGEETMLIIMKSEALVATIAPPEYLNTIINGLYFRSNTTARELAKTLRSLIVLGLNAKDNLEDVFTAEIIKWQSNAYIEANYEMAMQLITTELTSHGYPNRFRFKDRRKTGPAKNEVTKYGR